MSNHSLPANYFYDRAHEIKAGDSVEAWYKQLKKKKQGDTRSYLIYYSGVVTAVVDNVIAKLRSYSVEYDDPDEEGRCYVEEGINHTDIRAVDFTKISLLEVGSEVGARCNGELNVYRGVIAKITDQGEYVVNFTDGQVDTLKRHLVYKFDRLPKAMEAGLLKYEKKVADKCEKKKAKAVAAAIAAAAKDAAEVAKALLVAPLQPTTGAKTSELSSADVPQELELESRDMEAEHNFLDEFLDIDEDDNGSLYFEDVDKESEEESEGRPTTTGAKKRKSHKPLPDPKVANKKAKRGGVTVDQTPDHPHYAQVMKVVNAILSKTSPLLTLDSFKANSVYALSSDLARKVGGVLERDPDWGSQMTQLPDGGRYSAASKGLIFAECVRLQLMIRTYNAVSGSVGASNTTLENNNVTSNCTFKVINILLSDFEGMRTLFFNRNQQPTAKQLSAGDTTNNAEWCHKLFELYHRKDLPADLLKIDNVHALIGGGRHDIGEAKSHTRLQLYNLAHQLLLDYNRVFLKFDLSGQQGFDTEGAPFENFTTEAELIYLHYKLKQQNLNGTQFLSALTMLPEEARSDSANPNFETPAKPSTKKRARDIVVSRRDGTNSSAAQKKERHEGGLHAVSDAIKYSADAASAVSSASKPNAITVKSPTKVNTMFALNVRERQLSQVESTQKQMDILSANIRANLQKIDDMDQKGADKTSRFYVYLCEEVDGFIAQKGRLEKLLDNVVQTLEDTDREDKAWRDL